MPPQNNGPCPMWGRKRLVMPRLRAGETADRGLKVVDLLFDLVEQLVGDVAHLLLQLLAGRRGVEKRQDGSGEGSDAEADDDLAEGKLRFTVEHERLPFSCPAERPVKR